ncbi:hypothetical protein LSH36_191g03070 [Paralvinella palmiformis]|uniref:Vacuolar ATPase assembly integral membrane protein VMA21 homolog n=1 Tax=Paralvinella palmiformis TaxID=53620 RepID=A0AAD9JQN0_9ANNE|nr:hypothetical protein LSH36_191g03070 [Paralvinella palmiformis]
MSDLQAMRMEDNSSAVLCRLLFYSILMIVIPLVSYFVSKAFVFEVLLGMTSSNSYFYAAIVAIFTVHIILGLFVYVAWKEDTRPPLKKAD